MQLFLINAQPSQIDMSDSNSHKETLPTFPQNADQPFDVYVLEQIHLLWVRASSDIYRKASLNIVREVCDYLRDEVTLVGVFNNTLKVYGPLGVPPEVRTLNESFTGSIFSIITSSEILCIGKYPTSTSVASINFRTLAIEHEAPMRDKRNCPGVLRVDEFVYVFGGYAGGLVAVSSEKFEISSRRWKALPDMDNQRAYFSPVLHGRDILLADSCMTPRKVGSFNIDSETFMKHDLQIPIQSHRSLSYIVEHTLVHIANFQMWTWDIGTMNSSVTSLEDKSYDSFSASEIVQKKGELYWLDYLSRQLIQFDTRTNRFLIPPSTDSNIAKGLIARQ